MRYRRCRKPWLTSLRLVCLNQGTAALQRTGRVPLFSQTGGDLPLPSPLPGTPMAMSWQAWMDAE